MKQEEQASKLEKQTAVKNFFFLKKKSGRQKKQKLREKFPELTDDDLSLEDGNENGMLEKFHFKIGGAIGKTKEGLQKFIKAL